MKRSTRAWVVKAEEDLQHAQRGEHDKPLYDGICFHCQQCTEKYLKAMMDELTITIPKTHDLQNLLTLLLPHHPTLRPLARGLNFLTKFGVAIRYPGERATKRQATAAMRWAEKVRTMSRKLLGIKERPKRKK